MGEPAFLAVITLSKIPLRALRMSNTVRLRCSSFPRTNSLKFAGF